VAVAAVGDEQRVRRRSPNLLRTACGSMEDVVAAVDTANSNNGTRIHWIARPTSRVCRDSFIHNK